MINIHSHRPGKGAIYNLSLADLRTISIYPDAEQWLSVGIHPWDLSMDWEADFQRVKQWALLPQVLTIGETGLDKLKPTPCQEDAFRAHIALSEACGKPLIVHCVKAVDELFAIRKELNRSQPWIFHGFRGKPQQAEQLLKAGLYLSFGEHFHPESLRLCPARRLCVETDDSQLDFGVVCERIQKERGIRIESFSKDLFLK